MYFEMFLAIEICNCTGVDIGNLNGRAASEPELLTSTPTKGPMAPDTGLAAGFHATSITSMSELNASGFARFDRRPVGSSAFTP